MVAGSIMSLVTMYCLFARAVEMSVISNEDELKAEFTSAPFARGTVGMARASSPDSGDSQFFICFQPASFLNGKYTVWGTVVEGMENVDKIKRGEPVKDPDKIVKATMGA